MKDHYKTLGVIPSATQQEIKKSYRNLAFKYHPDKNPDNSLSEAHFKELQEAYATLSSPHKREKYDDERWLSGMGTRTQYKEAITSQWLLNICLELNASLAAMDTYRMSQKALQAYILLILADPHLGVLLHDNDKTTNDTIIKELLKATGKLDTRFLEEITRRLITLANNDNDMMVAIYNNEEMKQRASRNEKLLPYLVLLLTLALCIFMYYYAAWK